MTAKVERITRDAFLFLDPGVNPKADFAQCGPCRMFVPDEALKGFRDHDLCIIHGSDVKVDEGYSCGFMCGWPTGKPNPKVIADHAAELRKGIPGSVTPTDSGLVDRPVRCQNCDYHNAARGRCGLYEELNDKFPTMFNLDPVVTPYSCCNANTALPGVKQGNSTGNDEPRSPRVGPARRESRKRTARLQQVGMTL